MTMIERARAAQLRGSRGAAAVEFALIVPILMLILLGIINYGFMLSDRQAVSQAAAEGARAAAVSQGDPVVDGAAAAKAALQTQGLTCKSGSCSPVVASCGTGAQCATVKVDVDYKPLIPGFGVFVPKTLSYTAVARVS